MENKSLNKLYWGFWCSTTILASILAGFLISHSIMLGRFFNWYIDSGNVDLLHQTYSVYRETNAFERFLYNLPLLLSLVSGIIEAPNLFFKYFIFFGKPFK